MFMANYTIVDWGPHGMWLSDCSDDINNIFQWYGRSLTLRWNITMTKDFLAGLTVEWHPSLLLKLSSINKLGLNNGTFGNLLRAPSTEELGTWTGHFTGTSHSHSNYSFHYNHSYFIQACVPVPFVMAIKNLQFNKTLHSMTCISDKLHTCLNFFISTKKKKSFWFFNLDVVCGCQ